MIYIELLYIINNNNIKYRLYKINIIDFHLILIILLIYTLNNIKLYNLLYILLTVSFYNNNINIIF